ncbi:hypothetical protein HPP92_019432 [Vanilla planifolia]|uniref:Uncharacterized protein n=1 Tax=Vanilla planifolia TaxID=51239 RepID=A0A835Q2A3_VANPL|nr:hypothetical protein HPP92_019432 [Vanilla planifolia]
MTTVFTFPNTNTVDEQTETEKLQQLEEMTVHVSETQEKLLAEILRRNAMTEYLKAHKMNGATGSKTFKQQVPMVTYEDLKPYINRIADGDRSAILTGVPISELHISTGTSSGENKLIPFNDEMARCRLLFFSFVMPVFNKNVASVAKGKALYFLFVKGETKTAGGIKTIGGMTSFLKSEYSRLQSSKFSSPFSSNTGPTAAILCPDTFQSMYAQMLCGLYHRLDVLRLGSIFASVVVRAIRFLQLHWHELAHDIATGTLNHAIVTDPSVRESISCVMTRPKPDLARFITEQCSSGEWAGIIRKIWPNTRFIDAIVTGSMSQYINMLEYYGDGLPLASTLYVSSECCMGINLRPLAPPSEVSYLLLPNVAYFEFLPVGDEQGLVDMAHVELGKEYELVITNFAGLYRYRLGDVLRVAGFYKKAPLFQFARRSGAVLSVDVEKTDEAMLQRAVDRAAYEAMPESGTGIAEFAGSVDTGTVPGHYVVYVELMAKRGVAAEVMGVFCRVMEKALMTENWYYKEGREASCSIGPLEIRVVRCGTFEKMAERAIARGAAIGQYKVPRCIKLKSDLEMLDSMVVASHFSSS